MPSFQTHKTDQPLQRSKLFESLGPRSLQGCRRGGADLDEECGLCKGEVGFERRFKEGVSAGVRLQIRMRPQGRFDLRHGSERAEFMLETINGDFEPSAAMPAVLLNFCFNDFQFNFNLNCMRQFSFKYFSTVHLLLKLMREKSKYFLRFIVPLNDPESGKPAGLFRTAYSVREKLPVDDYRQIWLSELTSWFDDHLDRPDRFNKSTSKGYRYKNTLGLSWFKANANEHISKMREISEVLSLCGFVTNEIRTDKPGYIVYEDDNQIVAEPFFDTQTG